MFVYSCSIKNSHFRIWQTLGKPFLPPADCGSVFPAKSCWDAWSGCQEVRWIWWMRYNFTAQFFELLKHWLCKVWPGIVVEKNWALSVDQCQLQALQFSVYLNLLSILLRCNGFARIQRAEVGQTSSRPPNTDHDHFLVQVWFWEVRWCFFSVQPLS